MANTLTNLIPTIHLAADTVSRELTGLIPAVMRNSSAERAALNETIYFPVMPTYATADLPPLRPARPERLDHRQRFHGDHGQQVRDLPLVRRRSARLNNAGYYNAILRDQFTQAMRALVNEIRSQMAAAYKKASRAHGTAGTAPFGTAGDYSDGALVRKILADNGCPMTDLQLVVSTAAGANLRGKTRRSRCRSGRSPDLLRRGVLLDIHGFAVRESAQIISHTKGAGTGYDFAAAGEAVGQTTLSVEGGTVNTTGIRPATSSRTRGHGQQITW